MAEIIGDIKQLTGTQRTQQVTNIAQEIATSTTKVVSKINCEQFQGKDLQLNNNDAAQAITVKVWSSNMDAAVDIGVSGWEDDWDQVGSDIVVAVSSPKHAQWVSPSKWVAISATAGATATSLDTYFKLSGSL